MPNYKSKTPLEKMTPIIEKYYDQNEPIYSIRATDPDDLIGHSYEDYCDVMKLNENISLRDNLHNQHMYYMYFNGFANPYETIVQRNLYEALIWSYPPEFLRNRLIKEGIRKLAVQISMTIDDKLVVMTTAGNKEELKAEIGKYLDAYGYYLARECQYKDDKTLYDLIYEAKYDLEEMSEYVYETLHGLVFHVTKKKYLEKIMRYGLIPKSQNKGANYPDRIYVSGYRGEYGFKHFAKSLSDMDPFKSNSDEWVVLAIDLTAHPLWPNSFLRFFRDPNSPGKTSFYTVENIPPVCLRVYIDRL